MSSSHACRPLIRSLSVAAAGLSLWAAPALGQGQKLPVDLTLPPATVIGRPSTIGPGQATAIPFAQLASQLSQFGLLTNPLTFAQFPAIGANTVIGSIAGGAPIALTSPQLTAMINLATATLPGAVPAFPNNTTTFLRGDLTYATLNLGAIGGFGTGIATALGVNIGTAGAPVINGGALGTPSSGTVGAGVALGGVTMGLGSDATGDVYYNNGGVLTRLPKGSNGQVLELVSGLPAWASAAGTGTVNAAGTGLSLSGGGTTLNLALNNATLDASPAQGTGTTNTTGVMVGYGATCKITPVYSGRVRITITGAANGTQAGADIVTGKFADNSVTAAPANGAAPVGTTFGASQNVVSVAVANDAIPFPIIGVVTGLTVGHLYWADLEATSNSASSTLTILNPHCIMEEF
jgi:hypothetical protein